MSSKDDFISEIKENNISSRFKGRYQLSAEELINLQNLIQNRYINNSGETSWKPNTYINTYDCICEDIEKVLGIRNIIKSEYLRQIFIPRRVKYNKDNYQFSKLLIDAIYVYATKKLRNDYINSVSLKIFCEQGDVEKLNNLFNNSSNIDVEVKEIMGYINVIDEMKNNQRNCLALFITLNLLENEYTLNQCIDISKLLIKEKTLLDFFFLIDKDCSCNKFDIYKTESRVSIGINLDSKINKLKKAINNKLGNKNILYESIRSIELIKTQIWDFLGLIRDKYRNHSFVLPTHGKDFQDKLLLKYTNGNILNLKTLNKIIYTELPNNSEDNSYRNIPIFPPKPYFQPKFPATNLIKIQVKDFRNVLIKNEYENPTGTHKDRMSWEIVLKYDDLYNRKERSFKPKYNGPSISLISSGSAAFSLQYFFKLYDIPPLKVLVDKDTPKNIIDNLSLIDCEIFTFDLSKKLLSSDDIKNITKNKDGYDVTYREPMDANSKLYYDYLSFEILRESPEYCFIPFGTGDLLLNILKIQETQCLISKTSKYQFDHRFLGNLEVLKKCNFLAATTEDKNSKLDKLYSYYHPSKKLYVKEIKNLIKDGYIGKQSSLINVSEEYVNESIKIAKKNGILEMTEPSGIAGLALLLQIEKQIKNKDSKIIIINTGTTKYSDCLAFLAENKLKCSWRDLKNEFVISQSKSDKMSF